MTITLTALQQQRRDTASNWTSNNTVLLAGEWGIETDTKRFKIGDGTTAWQSLDYIPIPDVNRLLTGNLTVGGDLTVNGTTTTISTQNLLVEDKNIEIGKVSTPTDTTADGGGITLKGATDKTFNWLDATDSWTSSENIALGDNKKLQFGDSQDLQIFHDGTKSTILDNGTGGLALRGENTISMGDPTGNRVYLQAIKNGTVSLRHNNVVRLETSATGIDVTGTVDLSSAEANASNTSQFKLSNLTIGQHNNIGSYRFANAGTGSFLFSADAINFFNKDVNKNFLRLSASSVQLYHDNVKKAETSATGFDIPEDFIAGSGSKLTVGASGDLTLFHDSTNSYVQNNTGDLILGDTNHQYFRGNTSDKSVSLYFNGSEKAKTNNTGFSVTGSITASTGATFGGTATFASDGYFTTTTGITVENTQPGIILSDTTANPDFIIQNRDGSFAVRDITNAANRFLIDTSNGNITATGNISVTGTVDGVDIAVKDTLFSGLTSSSGVLTDGVTATTQSASDNSTKVATTAYVDNQVTSGGGIPTSGGSFTGDVTLTNQSDLKFAEATANGTNTVGFQAPASVASNVLWTLPATDAAVSGYALVSDGSGTLSWAAASGGGATGGGGEKIFHESENTMDNNYTISTNHNAVVPSPLTINATLTIPSGSVVTFV